MNRLGERTVRIRKVESSILFVSTIKTTPSEWFFFFVNASLEVFVWGYLMKTALITGASRGIGRAVARELAHQGWAVGINYLNRADKARELVEETVQSAERARLLRTCMAELHEDYREALFLVYFEGLSHAETAAVMGKREKQVADLIYRGKIALRKRLEQEGITDAYNG